MTPGTFLSLVPMLLGLVAVQPGVVEQSVTRLVVREEVILRVPLLPRPMLQRIDWIEHKGPKCIPAEMIRRAFLSGPQRVDFILADRTRVRAELDEDCPALDFYSELYLQPEDDHLCIRRDAVHSRIGGSCTIEHFKQLIPQLRR